jgi:hypothetical protein
LGWLRPLSSNVETRTLLKAVVVDDVAGDLSFTISIFDKLPVIF